MATVSMRPAERTAIIHMPEEMFGRVLFGLPFLGFGINHLIAVDAMAGAVPPWVPGAGQFWVAFTGVCMILAGISILVDRGVRVAGPLLALLLAVYTFALHVPGLLGGDRMEVSSILKNVALIGGALLVAARTAERDRRARRDTEAVFSLP
jgi:putative oxidoreductase